ncbi:hypothetical protein KJ633_07325 [bacterium]|nr:hypothetical protein [bacterium]MBU4134671.1 hypothetical protein [bacterium]
MNRNRLLAVFLLLLFSPAVFAADNPFFAKKSKLKTAITVRYPAPVQWVIKKIAPVQQRLTARLTVLTRQLKRRHNSRLLIKLCFFAFIYGVIHALGPGHGKTIIFSYFLSEQAEAKKGVLTGTIIAFMQSLSSIIIVSALYLFVRHAHMTSIENFSRVIKPVSYGLISLVGLFLMVKPLKVLLQKGRSGQNKNSEYSADRGSMLSLAFAVGIIPCPGAVILLLFSMSMQVLKIGVLLVLVMALGMAATISAAGVLSIVFRRGILNLFPGRKKSVEIFRPFAALAGSFVIFFMGLVLFFISL